jgi:glycosyltransferase involved in cell wall biosynthesis
MFWPRIGGIERLADRLIPCLQALGHEILIVAGADGDDFPERLERHGAAVCQFPFHQLLSSRDLAGIARARRCVLRLFDEFKPQLIHMHEIFPSAMFCMSVPNRPPLLLTLHCCMGTAVADGSLLARTIGSADWLTGCSQAALDQVWRAFPEIASRSSVVYSGVPAPDISPTPLQFDPPRILCLGRLRRGKGFDVAIAAFASICNRFPAARMTISGRGPEQEPLRRQAAEAALSDRIDFIGWADPDFDHPEATWELVNRSTMVVMPSRQEGLWVEGFGMVAIEASLMQRPVVASRMGGLVEAVEDGRTGLLITSDNVPELAAAMAFLLDNPQAARDMGKAGRRRSLERFHWGNHVVAGYNSLYHRLATET